MVPPFTILIAPPNPLGLYPFVTEKLSTIASGCLIYKH